MTTQGIQILVVELTKNLRCLTALGKDMFTGGFPVSEALMPVVMEKFPHLKLQRTWHLKSQQMTTICENSWRREKFRRIHSSHCAEGRLGEPEKRRKGRVFLKMSTHPKRSNEVRITSPGICHQELAVPSLDLVVSFPSLAEPLCLTGLYESLRLVIGSGCIGSERRMRRVDFQLGDESISDQPVPWRRVMQELLLALLGLGNKNLWESLKACDVLNPAEREIVDFLNGIGQKYAQIRHFIREQDRLNSEMINKGNSTPMRNTYLVEIAAGLSHTLLKPYEDRICLADKRFSEEPTWKLIRLHSWFYEYNWIFEVVVTLCKSFSELYGGKVFFLLKDALETCPDGLTSCLENLISRCQMVLYRQIMSWLVHDLLPPNDDFFIQRRGGKSNSVNDCEIIESFLPLYIDLTTANQILCIGVKNKLMLDCFEESGEERNLKLSQFNAKRNIYADKLKQIFVQRTFPQIEMSLLIDSWHKDITEQLWNQALQGQSFLSIFREINKFYFLGNGALFQYFIDLAEEQLPKTVGELGIVDSLNAVFRVAQGSFDCRSDVERVRLKLRAGASEDQSLFSAVELSLDLGRNKIFAHPLQRCVSFFAENTLRSIYCQQMLVSFHQKSSKQSYVVEKAEIDELHEFHNEQFAIDVLETLRRGFLLAVQQNCDIHRLPLLLEQFMDMLEKALMIRMADLCDLIDRLLLICECFCRCSKNADADENDDAERVHNTYISLERCMMTLYRILANPKTRQAYPLFSQLLLKLDMNNYFSNSNAIKYAKEEFMQSPKQKCQAKCHGKRIATFAITLCKPNVSSQTRSIMKAESIVSKTEVRRAKLHVMIDQLTQLCKDAPHPDDLRELLDDVMAFHDKTLEMQLQLEAALTGEERDQEAKHWAALSERTQIARREARARIRQMEGPLSDCSASSNDLGHHSNSKTSVRERLPELKMPVFSGEVLEFPAFWDRFQGCVHNRTDLDDASKFSYLLSSLSGEALAAVEGMPSSSANYSHAMELLQERFGRTDVIVREHVKAIWNAKPCSDSGASIQALVDEINRHLRCLTALGKNPATGEMTANEAFLPLLAEKFPEEIRLAWDVHVQSVSGTKGDLPEFLNFAQVRATAKRATAASSGGRRFVKQDDPKQQEPGPSGQEHQRTRQREKRAARGATTVLHAAVNSSCPICKGDHNIASCEDFLHADVHTRSRMAARNKLCFRCLQGGHRAKACKVRWRCTVSGCGGSHHELLHRSQSPPRDQTPEATRSRSCMLTANGGAQQVRLQSVRACAFGMDGQCVLVQCLLDPGSQSSFIRKDVADALGLTGPQEVIRLVTVDNEGGTERRMRRVEFQLGAVDPSQPRIRYPIQALVLPKICGKIRQAPVKLSEWPHLSSLPVADQCEERTFTIDVLIGLDHYFNLVGGDVRRGPAGGPVAIHSQLGWILCGQTNRRPTTAVTTLLTHVEESADQILRRFWELEAIGIATDNQTAPPDQEALQRFEEGLSFDGERYEVHLPWLPSRPSLPNNFPQARRRLLAVERRLARCEEERLEYAATMRQYVENGWAERAPEIGPEGRTWYLPHHAVYQGEGKEKKCRVVFDGSARYGQTSLNRQLEVGPNLQIDLLKALLRFRRYRVGLQADIQKMYLQVRIAEQDRDACRFLWRDKSGELSHLRLQRVCFGLTCSPFLAINTWDRRGDVLTFSPPAMVNSPSGESKRSLLSTAFRVFDPVGCLAPFTVRAKMFLQTLWQRGTSWDEPLPHDVMEQWRRWKQELPHLSKIRLPRALVPVALGQVTRLEIHAFCDSSEKAYGAVAYMRIETTNHHSVVNFVTSKTRVAPIRRLTLPRLELMGALVAARLVRSVQKMLGLQVHGITCWCDSAVTLAWIQSSADRWKPFVRNRVAEIQQLVEPAAWRHCPGRQNPADLLSRGTTLPKLLESPLWWHGPKWLAHPHNAWPVGQPITEDTSPVRDERRSEQRVTVGVTAHVERNSIGPERYGCVERLFRITAYCQRFVRNCRLPAVARQGGALTVAELRKAEGTWVQMAQSEAFSSELQALSRKGRVVATSRLSRLDPFMDEEGFLRVGGRLENAELPSHMKHPVILPGDHALTMGLIRRCHARQMHAGTTHTLAILRQQYWVLKGRTQVKKVIRHCFACRRAVARPIQPRMAALPSSRVVEAAAFAHTGMDFAGPLLIRVGKRATSKCYVCLFTCMASRAVHLELVPQMTTARVMQALRRFIARRGRPETIQSDNFRSFKAAASELRQLWRHVDVDRVQRELVGHRIHWKFITERAPWMGGYWERLVRSIKESLRKILGKALLDEEELRTTLCEVEASLNARPLTFVGEEDHERHPLSPFQLLTGRAYVDFPAIEAHDPEWQPVERGATQWSHRWRYRQQLLARWWRSWRREYLSELMQRQKWRSSPAGPEVNDLVLILEDNIPRAQCPIGVITALHLGSDGIARSARIRTSTNVITRPVAKLVQLEPTTVSDGRKTPPSGGEDVADRNGVCIQRSEPECH
ncbi:Gamma-tubulin complex component 4 [Trichinella patagoniensis]|uniref:Gamma-tubulin complex component 4 n=1 Tax=Trichinella patagoniensis TaxID=990121 RepID=A0A0V1AAK0_9BILA|nr:Gamma-tubulin complex component 4 [Trichinella patagoniensis]